MHARLFAMVLGAALLGPAISAHAQPTTTVVVPTQSADDGQYEADMWNGQVFASGAVIFGGAYLASVIAAEESSRTGDHHLYVPLAGPWLDLADRSSCRITDIRCDDETSIKVLLIADGVFQAAGVLGMLDAIVSPTHHRRVVHVAKREVHIAPTVKDGAPGLQVFGKF